tara:strand:+ start:422 stop:871 length:450 start_codon:yes stop_codon:yes gene_type:complete
MLVFVLFIPTTIFCKENVLDNKPPRISTNFVLEVYENGKKTNRELYVDLKIMSKTDVQWTTVFLHSIQSVKDEASWWVPFVSRWEEFIYDVEYDNHNFQIKMNMAGQEMIVRGRVSSMLGRFKVEGVGFTSEHSGENIKSEWKSIANFD